MIKPAQLRPYNQHSTYLVVCALLLPWLTGTALLMLLHWWLWWLLPIWIFAHFTCSLYVVHELVHAGFGIKGKTRRWLLSIYALLLLESGHSYQLTHTWHHAHFPNEEDPEGSPAYRSPWQCLLMGPGYLLRLWQWSWRRATGKPVWRQRLLAEAVAIGVIWLLIIAVSQLSYTPLLYVLICWLASCGFPLLTSWLPHHNHTNDHTSNLSNDLGHDSDKRLHASTTRPHRAVGISMQHPWLAAWLLHLGYHAEHHAWPQVPGHQLRRLIEEQQTRKLLTNAHDSSHVPKRQTKRSRALHEVTNLPKFPVKSIIHS